MLVGQKLAGLLKRKRGRRHQDRDKNELRTRNDEQKFLNSIEKSFFAF
jgi:hypothetical protein